VVLAHPAKSHVVLKTATTVVTTAALKPVTRTVVATVTLYPAHHLVPSVVKTVMHAAHKTAAPQTHAVSSALPSSAQSAQPLGLRAQATTNAQPRSLLSPVKLVLAALLKLVNQKSSRSLAAKFY
jgi:hypothetical protein